MINAIIISIEVDAFSSHALRMRLDIDIF